MALEKNRANFAPLTPLTFLRWSGEVCPDRLAIVHGARRFTWGETYARCRRLASALARLGIAAGDTVAVMLANTPEMLEVHFGVPMLGAILNTLNTRLDAATLAFMLGHGEAKVLLCDREYSAVMTDALSRMENPPLVVDIDDSEYAGPGTRLGTLEYEAWLAAADPDYHWQPPADEWESISLNYTSGTTGNPKGVVYSHRGAYLNALGDIMAWSMPRHPVFLWTVPMFHCNGWCFPWAIAALTGVNVCLRKVEAATIYRLMKEHGVTHYGGAPIVHNLLLNAPASLREGLPHRIKGIIAGAAPPVATIAGMERIGFDLTHVYGLTESYGPATSCVQQEGWADLPVDERAQLNGRQGVRFLLEEECTVLHPDTLQPVPPDGETIGEIMFRGNILMKGYLKNPAATEEAFAGGWFHSGDLAVLDSAGYMKIKDRSKDVIISGGENISSLEVEDALCHHPAVLAAAVVARPDEKWGETPCAFVELKDGAAPTERELIDHCRAKLAHYKAPKTVVFGPLPKTSTGKVQKYALRDRAREL